jgi:hypothetical protein
MVRRGSTVRVRQRALQKARKSGLLLSDQLAGCPVCGRYGALYGAFRSKTRAVRANFAVGRASNICNTQLEALRDADPELVEEDSAALGALGRVLDALADGGRALVVGHSPTNEAAVL